MAALNSWAFTGFQTMGTWIVTQGNSQTPSVVSASPSSGSGSAQTFSFTFRDPAGYAHLNWLDIDLHTSLDSNNACYIEYNRAANLVMLANDAGDAWAATGAPGSAGTLQNLQCEVRLANSSVSAGGSDITLTLALRFRPAFAGAKTIYMAAMNNSMIFSGWQAMGLWTATSDGTLPPVPVSVSPSTGSGSTQTFDFTYRDPAGYSNLNWVNLDFHSFLTNVNTCYVQYERATNLLRLADDSGAFWIGPGFVGSPGVLHNSQCSVDVGASSASGSGNNLTVRLVLTFKPVFAGSKNIFMGTLNGAGLFSGWSAMGTWTAP